MDDERFYQQVADELREGRTREALWTKAIAQSMGDEQKTKALYIRMRVDQLMQEDARKSNVPAVASSNDLETESPSKAAKAAQMALTIILILIISAAVKWILWPKLRTYF